MQRNQIDLSDRPLEKNREFLRKLYQTKGLKKASRWFDKRDSLIARQADPEMNLDRFLAMMDDTFFVKLQTGSPFPEYIRCCASGHDGRRATIFAWVECPYDEHNYSAVSALFKDVYSQEIEAIPVPEALKEYHRRFD